MKSAKELKAAVEAHIQHLGLEERRPANLYEPMAYLLSLKGKRIRPVLTLLAYEAISGQNPQQALNLACALELFHNFTLMHDDIMDRAPVRRGQPTVHTKWDENIAILSGDALFAYSMELTVKDFPQQSAPLVQEFSRVAMEVCEGQMEDMDLAVQEDVDIPAYLEMIRKKTAVLLGGCLSLGALAGGAAPEQVALLRAFGENLGVAFQLQDDLMDAFPPEGFGKQVGGDIIENKKTYLLLKALELADGEQKNRLAYLMQEEKDNPGKVAGVLEIFNALEIREETEKLIAAYFEKARQLSAQLAGSITFDSIRDYLQVIAQRQF